MTTITRQEAINSTLLEILSTKHHLVEKNRVFINRFGCTAEELEKKVKESPENFEVWDTLMEWKSVLAMLVDVEKRLMELEHGEFSFS
ncbi:MAG: hypothetical protein JNL74_24280 [Fibrobacteres bacterium]|nr:hypothetical protein [Fibrobacterota bacterium]